MPNIRPKSHKKFCKKLRELKAQKKLKLSTTYDDNHFPLAELPSNSIDNSYEAIISFINLYILKEVVELEFINELVCPHVNISSAMLYRHLYGKFSLLDVHQMYFTGINRIYGRMAEDFIFKNVKNLNKGFCLFSDIYPWICASPDGYLSNIISRKQRNRIG